MTAGTYNGASPLAPLVDEQRLGSAGGQAMVGIAGIVLAVVLIVGQISLATTKGIANHLHNSVAHITEGNKVMESVVARAAPATEMEKALAAQEETLGSTRDAMVETNSELAEIMKTKETLLDVVTKMETSGNSLASGVNGVATSTGKMTNMLGQLPGATQRTHKQLSRINGDTNAINGELGAIGDKMTSYGLPQAQGAPTG